MMKIPEKNQKRRKEEKNTRFKRLSTNIFPLFKSIIRLASLTALHTDS